MQRLLVCLIPYAKQIAVLIGHDEKLVEAGQTLIDLTMEIITSQGKHGKHGKSKEQIERLLFVVLDLLLPFAGKDTHPLLCAMLQATLELKQIGDNPSSFGKRAPALAGHLGVALGASAESFGGIFAMVNGDWRGCVNFCRPFCDLQPETLEKLAQLLPTLQKHMQVLHTDAAAAQVGAGASEADRDHAERMKQVMARVEQGKASSDDLFKLVDADGSGLINVSEFQTLTCRLGYNLSSHRLIEIFSHCKKQKGKKTGVAGNEEAEDLDAGVDLDLAEFEAALKYLRNKIALNSMSQLGRTLDKLMGHLIFLAVLLVLIFVFLFLGIGAFSTESSGFHSVVNSIMPLASGLGLMKRKIGVEKQDAGVDAQAREVIADIQKIVLDAD